MNTNVPNKYHLHNYQHGWIDVTGQHHKWEDIEDGYLHNIRRKIRNSKANAFPYQAEYYCEKEIERRKPAVPARHINCRSSFDDHAITALRYSLDTIMEQTMKTEPMNGESTDTSLLPMVPDADLSKYWLKKVMVKSIQEKGRVIQLNIQTSGRYQLEVKLLTTGKIMNINANAVELVDVVKVFCYQHKDGSIEMSSKKKADATLKRMKITHLVNGDKEIDL